VRRFPLVVLCLTTSINPVQGQQQEDKLVNRLLRPNLSLENPQQNKQFVPAEKTTIDRKFEAKNLNETKSRSIKRFVGIRNFSAKNFKKRQFSRSDWAANAARIVPPFAHTVAPTKESLFIKDAPEANKTAQTRDYSDTRPFLGKGTRQEILSHQGHPLSIEEVRELLNKDKSPTDSP
jgi:hypothetical protein